MNYYPNREISLNLTDEWAYRSVEHKTAKINVNEPFVTQTKNRVLCKMLIKQVLMVCRLFIVDV